MAINFKNWQKSIKEALLPEENLDEATSPTAGTRLVKKYGSDAHRAEVRYNPEYQEYQVHHYKDGKHRGEGPVSYHGNDKQDAHDTAKSEAAKHSTVKEEAELNEDNLESIAKKHGMQFKRTAYGAGMTHPKHGEISINRYGEWHHKGTKTQGDSSGNFASLDKHLSSLKEETDIAEEISKSDVPAYLRKAKGEKPLTVADVKEPKKSTISAPANLAKARNEESSCKKKTYEQFVSEAAAMVDDGEGEKEEAKELKTNRRADKKVAKDGRKYSGLIKFNNGEEDGTRVTEDFDFDLNEETTYYMEAMIDYSDFQSKVDAHKKAGNKVVDYKHTSEKAHITTIDKEGTKRKVIYKPSGVSMQNLGKHEGDDSDDNGNKVKKTDNEPAVKRGRGRPTGAKSGARQTGSAKQEYRGLAFHSLNLPNKK